MESRNETLAREKKWALPAGIAAVAGVAMYFIGMLLSSSGLGSPEGTAAILEAVSKNSSTVSLGSLIQGLGIALLAAPLSYLFLAANARSDRMLKALIMIVIAGPVFLGLGTFASALSLVDASDKWQGDNTPGLTKCFEEKAAEDKDGETDAAANADAKTEGSASEANTEITDEQKDDCRDEVAADLRGDGGTSGIALALLAGGGIGFLVALLYTGFNAMRAGLLTRFWGSLGMAIGVILLLPQLQIIAFAWFIYLGLLIAGWIPGGRPPAWAAGKAIPWPVPGERPADDDEVIEGTAEEIDPGDAPEAEDLPAPSEPRKRKKRN